MPIRSLLALAVALAVLALPAAAEESKTPAAAAKPATPIAALAAGTVPLVDAAGKVILPATAAKPENPLPAPRLAEILAAAPRDDEAISALWYRLAEAGSLDPAMVPVIRALLIATDTPKSREGLWSALLEQSKSGEKGKSAARGRTLLGHFERQRRDLLPLLVEVRETEGGGDEMVDLMLGTRIFGADLDDGLSFMLARNPAALARRMERERVRGRPVSWETRAFRGMLRWRDTYLVPGAPKAPTNLATLDAHGESFVIIFNNLHPMDESWREQMLRGMGATEVVNAAVGGEQQLYRLGTSGYRGFLHPVILAGIKKAGSLEGFLASATPAWLGDEAPRIASRRAMVLLRIATSFGLADSVLETIRDRERFIDDAIAAVGNPRDFESSSGIVVDLLTSRSASKPATAFRESLRDRLYATYGEATEPARRSVLGGILSAYQTVSGDRRDPAIDRDFPLDEGLLRVPFDRLFADDGKGNLVHRMFMRLDQDTDAVATYDSVRALMRERGASVREGRHALVFRETKRRRTIEIHVNKPTAAGVTTGIDELRAGLAGARVETIFGRGHTGIVSQLQKDSQRLLGERIKSVALVLVGTCGGDASVRELIGTFGYVPFVTTKATGRQIINNALLEAYIDTLLALPGDGRLGMPYVLDQAVEPFLSRKGDEELREDARLYRVNMVTGLAALLFDTHVRRHAERVAVSRGE